MSQSRFLPKVIFGRVAASIAFLTMGYLVWAVVFIVRSSFVGLDGKRYFSLFDDAMISMRYAWNLANGHGLVWNTGEPVEGYTNLLMVLLMAPVNASLPPRLAVLAIQILGAVLVLGTLFFVLRTTRQLCSIEPALPDSSASRAAVTLSILSYYPISYWSLMGMETGLLCFLLAAFVSQLFTLIADGSPAIASRWALFGFTGALIGLTRPDAATMAVIGVAILFWEKRVALWEYWPRVLLLLATFGIPLLFQMGFRWHYYHELVPNTALLKLGDMPLGERLRNGIGYLSPFFVSHSIAVGILAVSIIRKFTRFKLYCVGFWVWLVAYQVFVGGDPWRYWRILAPAMPLVLVLVVVELNCWVGASLGSHSDAQQAGATSRPRSSRWSSMALTVGVVLIALLVNRSFWDEMCFRSRPYQVINNEKNVNDALALKTVLRNGASVGVFWAGVIPYYLEENRVVDFLGKSDKYIARLKPDLSGKVSWNGMNSVPGHNKYDLRYSILRLMPTFVQGYDWGGENLKEDVAALYVVGTVMEREFLLLRGSDLVRWDRVSAVQQP